MKRVFICSAFRAEDNDQEEVNKWYARELCRYAIDEGYAPFAPHLLYPQFLSDLSEVERSQGIRAGIMFMQTCQELWFGVKHGLSEGMKDEISHAAKSFGIPIYIVISNSEGGFTRDQTEKLPQAQAQGSNPC